MKILMLHSAFGSEDGFAVRFFEAGLEYEVADSLAWQLIKNGLAKWVLGNGQWALGNSGFIK